MHCLESSTETQDGVLCVWDRRSSKVLRKMEFHDPCRRARSRVTAPTTFIAAGPQRINGCYFGSRLSFLVRCNRCVKFSASPLDLLVVNQHARTAHVLDARTYAGSQSLTIPIFGQRNNLTGACQGRVFFAGPLHAPAELDHARPHTWRGASC